MLQALVGFQGLEDYGVCLGRWRLRGLGADLVAGDEHD